MTLGLVGVVTSVGLADSLSPTTVGPALYLATTRKAALRVTLFTLGVFAVNLVAGLILMTGPGRWLLGLVPRPQRTARHVIELVAGVILILLALALWRTRRELARRELPMQAGHSGSAFLAGVSIAAVELPTAFPYFAVVAAVVASSANLAQQIALVGLYNVVFVVPLLAIILVLLLAGKRADVWLRRGGTWLQRRWPVVLSCLLLLVGGILMLLGGAGLVRQ